jgi:hypothetical protein
VCILNYLGPLLAVTGGLLPLLPVLPFCPVLPFVAVTGGLLEVSSSLVQLMIDNVINISMLAKNNFFIF